MLICQVWWCPHFKHVDFLYYNVLKIKIIRILTKVLEKNIYQSLTNMLNVSIWHIGVLENDYWDKARKKPYHRSSHICLTLKRMRVWEWYKRRRSILMTSLKGCWRCHKSSLWHAHCHLSRLAQARIRLCREWAYFFWFKVSFNYITVLIFRSQNGFVFNSKNRLAWSNFDINIVI